MWTDWRSLWVFTKTKQRSAYLQYIRYSAEGSFNCFQLRGTDELIGFPTPIYATRRPQLQTRCKPINPPCSKSAGSAGLAGLIRGSCTALTLY